MKFLPEIFEELGVYIAAKMKIDGDFGVLAKAFQTDSGIQYADKEGKIMLPSNECELGGFHFVDDIKPQIELFGCNYKAAGYHGTSFAVFWGSLECGWPDIDKLVNTLFAFEYSQDGLSAIIRTTKITTNSPKIIQTYFASMSKNIQSAQTCTTLFKIDYTIEINC